MIPHGLGVGIPHQLAVGHSGYYQRALGILRPQHWYNWLYDQVSYIYPPYIPMVWAMRIDAAAQRAMTQSHYGPRLWLIGNEPERKDQSDTPPAEAATFSRWWKHGAAHSPAAPGVLLGLPAAYQWLDAYLLAGGEVGAAWHVHLYAWTADHWDGMLSEFLSWMRRRGVERPVIVSETASWDTTLPAQQAIMDRVRVALDAGTIQAAAWFSTGYPGWAHSDLLTLAGTLTLLGEHYMGLDVAPAPALDNVVFLPGVMA